MVSGINSATHQLKKNKIHVPIHCISRKMYPYDCFMVAIQSLLTALMSLTEVSQEGDIPGSPPPSV